MPPAPEEHEAGVAQLAGALARAGLAADEIELGGEEVLVRPRVAEKAPATEEELRGVALDGAEPGELSVTVPVVPVMSVRRSPSPSTFVYL